MWNTPGTSRERSQEFFHSTDGICDGTDTYLYTEHDEETNLEQHHPIPTNSRSSNYDLSHNSKLDSNDDYRF